MKRDTGGAAFPRAYPTTPGAEGRKGMDLLDWFAGKATEEDIQTHRVCLPDEEYRLPSREEAKYRYAAAMIAEKRRREAADE